MRGDSVAGRSSFRKLDSDHGATSEGGTRWDITLNNQSRLVSISYDIVAANGENPTRSEFAGAAHRPNGTHRGWGRCAARATSIHQARARRRFQIPAVTRPLPKRTARADDDFAQ